MPRMKPKSKIYPVTPGPRNCMRLNVNTRACETFGSRPAVLHTPIRASGGTAKCAYPNALRSLITADAGGSNGPRLRLWKEDANARSRLSYRG
jgi:hypothetical protein